jgi:two-component system phosphate regulon sensor histidine kinase PhoR
MDQDISTYDKLLIVYEEVRMQLEEANDSLQAIRTGQVDAFVVHGENGHQLYTLKTADQTYRVFIEKMNEGAVTLNRSGLILYSNSRFAEMIDAPLENVLGLAFEHFIPLNSKEKFIRVIENGWTADCKEEITLITKRGREVPCLLSCNTLELDEGTALSLILTDLTIQKRNEQILLVKNEELATAQNATAQLNDELENIVAERTSDLSISREHFKLLADNIPQMT